MISMLQVRKLAWSFPFRVHPIKSRGKPPFSYGCPMKNGDYLPCPVAPRFADGLLELRFWPAESVRDVGRFGGWKTIGNP